ncbi:MAG TPA: tetratricopeptide repeat protein [Caulobacter sp.]|nr:tetratricopeptide repeat protein [Caulobacter sp.]
MTIRDHHGLALSGASQAGADKYQQALEAYHCYAGDPVPLLDEAIAESPTFVMAHVLKAYLHLIASNPEAAAVGVEVFETVRHLPCNDREQGHIAAIGSMLAGEIRAAQRLLEDVTIAEPRDSLALQVGQLMDFTLGDSRMLRDRIGRALPHWSRGMPGFHAVQGMLSFGLEETGLYDRAEAAGRLALEIQPRNGWAKHAVVHVLEMQGRRAEGVAFLRGDLRNWTEESFFQIHNWWHLALFHLGLGETEEVLKLFDGPVFGSRSTMAVDLVDAAAMLWRLHLLGLDVSDRWSDLADLYAPLPRGQYAFDDAHAMMAFVGAGRQAEADELIAAQHAALSGPGDNAMFVREVGLPVVQALAAFGKGDYRTAVDLLRGVRSGSARFGGSHAQRDLIDLTLIESARRGGDRSLEAALQAERANARGQDAAMRLAAE